MREKPSLPEQQVIHGLNAHYGIEVKELAFLPLGADSSAFHYKAQGLDGTCYFLKLKRGHFPDVGIEIVQLLQQAGVQPIIPPLNTIQGRQALRVGDFTLIVYPFVEGKDGFRRALTDNQWMSLGKALRQIHEVHVPLSLQNKVRKEVYSPKWRELVRSLYVHIEGKPRGDRVALNLLQFMKKHMQEIRRLVDRAEQLSQTLQHQSFDFVLCHGDIHGGNVLLNGNEALYIVDWDDPLLAPKERDLMFVGGGVANVWNKPREEKLFYEGYGKTEVNATLLAYYRHERIVEDIAQYGQALLLTLEGGEDRAEMYKQFVAQFEPQGVVDRAFDTN